MWEGNKNLVHVPYRQHRAVTFIACPSAWSIQVSFFYVPKNYPKRIREKKQSPWTIQILSQNFWQNLVKKTNNWNYPRKKTNTLNYPNTIWYFGDLARFSRILEIFVKKLINNYTFDKSNHLELSDSILGLSQIFSDTI